MLHCRFARFGGSNRRVMAWMMSTMVLTKPLSASGALMAFIAVALGGCLGSPNSMVMYRDLADIPERPGVTEQLPRLREVFLRHPGGTTVSLTLRVDSALEVETAPLPCLTVTPSERFVADVEEVLGNGAIFLLS
jgi:hypothetical protein